MQAFAGLGNPGAAYCSTRHNAGYMLLDVLAAKGSTLERRTLDGVELLRVRLSWGPLWLVRPVTYMNRSGYGISRGCDALKLSPTQLVVAYDDVDLPLGRLRLRRAGGPGGHRGLRSVLDAFGCRQVPRLRLGVRGLTVPADTADYVLAEFTIAEKPLVRCMIDRAVEAVELIARDGLATAMNSFNAWSELGAGETTRAEDCGQL